MPVYQKVFFYLFILLFLVLCPILLLYSFGHLSETDLQPKGSLYLSTIPEGGAVYINNRLYAEKTPAFIADILPGTYNIRLALNGYESCDYRLNIAPNRTVSLDKILFKPKVWLKQELVA